MQRLWWIAIGLLISCCATLQADDDAPTDGSALVAGSYLRTLEVDGKERSYFVHVPPSYDESKPMPVVVVLHGAMMNGPMMAVFSGMSKKADDAGFIAVYPNGTGKLFFLAFNVWGKARKDAPDDVAYIDAVLDDVEANASVDKKRVYACGLSNGGMMSYRLAAERSDRFAAIAPVAGTMPGNLPRPKRPVSVMHFHGTDDTIVPFSGPSKEVAKWIVFKSVPATMQTWAKLNGCSAKPEVEDLPDTADDETTVKRKSYGLGTDGAETILIEIDGGGHTWPGQPPWVKFLGRSTSDISANDMIWTFFERHPLP